jgi:Extensin-like protein C-terminus
VSVVDNAASGQPFCGLSGVFRYSAVPVPSSRSSFALRPLAALLAAAAALIGPSTAHAFSPYLVVPPPAVAEASPAYRYANMTDAEALAELDKRGILHTRLDAVPGVRAPIRLTGRLHGVHVHSSLPPDQRVRSPFEILDARLALALDDFCAVLERHDIDEIVHFTMYRPSSPGQVMPEEPAQQTSDKPAGARPRPATKAAPRPPPAPGPAPHPHGKKPGTTGGGPTIKRQARRDPTATGLPPTTWAPPGTRHPAGLAIDVGLVHKRDGRWLTVARDFRGKIGAQTCGAGARVPDEADARELRALVCESAAEGVFTYVLTPDYNAAHADHFHMEIKPGVRWFLYN